MEQAIINHVINGNDLWNWFFLGAKEVFANRKYINSINVFPVADGDTGTNLATTINAMVEKSSRNNKFSGMIRSMSASGLEYARGNSGILFATYINGLALEGNSYDEINKEDFSMIAHRAVCYMYEAIENPIEGTMITVIRDWADFLYKNQHRYISFQDLLADAYKTASISLQNTTSQLAILKKYKVVDSGADGFLKFLNGINRYFSGGEIDEIIPWDLTLFEDGEYIESNNFQFCTEVYIDFSKMKLYDTDTLDKNIKSKISHLGDSLIVSCQSSRIRVHIHTNEPEVVVDLLKDYGKILEQKVDNMYLQNSVKAKRISNIGILTDSIADIPEEFKLNNQIHTLPLGLLLNDSIYLDKLTIQLKQLFQSLNGIKTYPTSSQPEPGRIKVFLENLLEKYDHLIFITVSSQMSGTYQSITQALNKLDHNNKKVTIIDSKVNSGAQGLLVKRAAELVGAGSSYDEIVKEIKSLIPKTSIYVCLSTLEYAVRSGRVPNTIGRIGMFFGMRPIMTIDKSGNGAAFGVGFSKKGITKKIFKLIRKKLQSTGIQGYSIVHADNLELAMEYKRELTRMIGKEPEFVTEISSIVAIHSGLGCVAVSLIE